MKSQLELLFSNLNSNVEKTELFIALSKSSTPAMFSHGLGTPMGFMVFVEVAAGGCQLCFLQSVPSREVWEACFHGHHGLFQGRNWTYSISSGFGQWVGLEYKALDKYVLKHFQEYIVEGFEVV